MLRLSAALLASVLVSSCSGVTYHENSPEVVSESQGLWGYGEAAGSSPIVVRIPSSIAAREPESSGNNEGKASTNNEVVAQQEIDNSPLFKPSDDAAKGDASQSSSSIAARQPESLGSWSVCIGSFSTKAAALKAAKKSGDTAATPRILDAATIRGHVIYRLIVGDFTSHDEAKEYAVWLISHDYRGAWVLELD